MNDPTSTARSGTDTEDDATLIARIRGGDRAAFERMMRRYNRRLYRLARATLRDEAEAQDALQEAYLHAYRSIGQFRGEAALSTWLSRLVLNECFGRRRRSDRRDGVVRIVSSDTDSRIDTVPGGEVDLPDRLADRAQMLGILESKLDELPEEFRTVFVLRSVEELSVEETAATLGIPEATVRSRHFRAKGLLREALAREVDLAERDIFEFGGRHCDQVIANVLGRLADSPQG
jgi:RNA polymerase sigma-70 factor (ECF subfamily)